MNDPVHDKLKKDLAAATADVLVRKRSGLDFAQQEKLRAALQEKVSNRVRPANAAALLAGVKKASRVVAS